MAGDVADVVVASATFLYVFEEENDEKERRRRIRRRPLRFWIHDLNHRREVHVCDNGSHVLARHVQVGQLSE